MGLHVHSLNNIPKDADRDYFIYLLEYGWHEPLAAALSDNFNEMAKMAANSRAVVIRGTELSHFSNEVFSWHKINNQDGDKILPAILITNAPPSYFLGFHSSYKHEKGLYKEDADNEMKLILIPLKKFCTTTTEVVTLIQQLFNDINAGHDLSNFKIAKKIKRGVASAIVDSIILEPNVSGMGFSFKKMVNYMQGKV